MGKFFLLPGLDSNGGGDGRGATGPLPCRKALETAGFQGAAERLKNSHQGIFSARPAATFDSKPGNFYFVYKTQLRALQELPI